MENLTGHEKALVIEALTSAQNKLNEQIEALTHRVYDINNILAGLQPAPEELPDLPF